MEYVQLNNGIKMPMLGYGVYQVTKDECERCVTDALSVGYRLIDTAQSYFNEEEVGAAIAKSGIPREEIFLTTKVWVEHYGYEACKKSVYTSLEKLKTDYLDLMLLHQPFSDHYGAYRALEELYNEGVLRAIGVSNFYPDRLVDIASFANIVPMVNQVETHVLNQQKVAKEYMDKYGVQCEAWAPFGEGRGGLFENETLVNIGKKYGKTAAQVMLRWNIQRGVVVLPKSTHRDRMIQNIDVFDFTLSDEDELQREGITVPEERIVYGDLWYTSGERLAQELLSGERPMPEAVIAASDHMALGLIEQLTKNGVRVPEDLIVLESEATSEAITGDISLSSYESNDAKTAADAVDAIRRQIEPDAPILPYEPEMDTMFHAGMSCGCQPDLVRSGQAFKDSLYLLTRNYSASDLLDHIDIGFLMESYVSEQFSAAETPEYCLHAIFDSTYLLSPFENFFLCLKEDRLDTSRDIADGYPAQMQIALAASSVGEAAFCRRSDAILFDTGEMLPRLQAESETPSVFYFSPVHFNEKMLGYAVLQRSLTDPHPIDLVYRNWLRFVNNALQMIRVQRRLLHLSVHDEMTGAYDRRGMYTAVEKLLQNAPEGASVLACVIDMDGLKYINDTFGHDEGDFGIRTVAQAAQKLTGPEEIFVRAGGDEFYILGIGIYDSAEINRRILAFEADMTDRSNRAAKPYPLTASIGCSLHRLAEQDSIHNAIRDADAAMYRYKTKRKRDRTV